MLINIIYNDFKTKNKASGNSNALLWIVLISLLLGASFFMGITKNWIGFKNGHVTVVEFYKRTAKTSYWWYVCECGNKKVASISTIRMGNKLSCGCLTKKYQREAKIIHGKENTKEYNAWSALKKRCYTKTNASYLQYGGRGIKVCDRWLCVNGLNNFIQDMGFAPTKNHSVDRINCDGDYTPENCRWATSKEQGRNRRNNRMIIFGGETKCLADWSEELNLPKYILGERLKRLPIEIAFTMKYIKKTR